MDVGRRMHLRPTNVPRRSRNEHRTRPSHTAAADDDSPVPVRRQQVVQAPPADADEEESGSEPEPPAALEAALAATVRPPNPIFQRPVHAPAAFAALGRAVPEELLYPAARLPMALETDRQQPDTPRGWDPQPLAPSPPGHINPFSDIDRRLGRDLTQTFQVDIPVVRRAGAGPGNRIQNTAPRENYCYGPHELSKKKKQVRLFLPRCAC